MVVRWGSLISELKSMDTLTMSHRSNESSSLKHPPKSTLLHFLTSHTPILSLSLPSPLCGPGLLGPPSWAGQCTDPRSFVWLTYTYAFSRSTAIPLRLPTNGSSHFLFHLRSHLRSRPRCSLNCGNSLGFGYLCHSPMGLTAGTPME